MGNFTNSSSLIQEIEGKQKRIVQSATTPATPQSGDYWFDTTNLVLKHYNGTAREIVGANVRVITQEDYDDLTPAEKQNGTLYLITGDSEELTIKWSNITNKPSFATVATSGSYNDLTDKPTIPSSLGDLSGNSDNITEGSTHKFVTAAEKSKISTAVQPGDLATVATSGSYNDLSNTPTIPSALGDLTGTSDNITEGTTHKFVTTAEKDKISTAVQPGDLATVATSGDYNDLINLPSIPVDADDVNALPDTTKYGASLSLSMNTSTYVVTAQLKDQDGNNLGTAQTVDLPLESVVVSGSYDSATKKVILTLKDGSTVDFSVADLISGLQSEITSTNKLDADLVDDTNSAHKFVSATEKSTWNGKQDALTTAQLNAVNSGITSAKVSTYDGYATSKQDKLTTQTAYSQKGSATKVPQITTNTLGQVTGITEVDINAGETYSAGDGISISQENEIANTGVLSVNGQTGNVTIASPDMSNYLAKDNTTSYTPTGDYQPATKKYVDDNAGSEYNAGEGISIGNTTINARKGPAPDGFHVPAITEWRGIKTIMNGLSLTTGNNWRINLHMPFAGYRINSSANLSDQDSSGYYWSSSPYGSSNPDRSPYFQLASSYVMEQYYYNARGDGLSVRAFKDTYVTPDSSWTVIQGALGSAGIFWDQSQGLISITDGTTGYTMMDKNLGATTVYNDGDTLTQANMGNMYQWGNNYGFPSTGTISKTSSTKVDASGYGPSTANGYYKSDTFIKSSSQYPEDWSSVHNDDLRGDTTGTYTQENVISNTGVLSVNGQTGNVTIASPDMSNYLAKDNTTSYTPTGDYQPATKKYVDDNAGGDMYYADYNRSATTGATVTLSLNTEHTPSANFTVNAPATIKDGQTYILRVANGAIAYTMTLGTNITNPYSTSTTLTANGIDQFVFVAKGGSLELQPEIQGGGSGGGTRGSITGTLSDQTDLNTALNAKANTADVLTKNNTTTFTPTGDYQPATKKYVDDNAGGEQNLFIITEDMVTVSTSEDTGVAPYNTSYKYTNFDINANAGIEWKEGAIYTFVVDTKMVVASAYRNVRVRIGSGAYIPVMATTAAAAGNSYFAKTAIRQFQYTTKYESGGALHVFTDSNTTYKAMTEAQATAGTATTALTISPSILKGAITTHAPVKSVNGSTGAVTGLQTTANLKTNLTDNSDSYYPSQKAVKTAVDAKQATLVSGTNIKTINNTSVLGSGNIAVQATISDLSTIRTNATNGATVVSGNSGQNYIIKVSTTAPTSGTANNVITIVTN